MTDTPEAAGDPTPPPEERTLLSLQGLEQSLIRAVVANPAPILPREVWKLRYAIAFAALERFSPGASAGTPGRGDVTVSADLVAPFRAKLLELLTPALRHEQPVADRLSSAAIALRALDAPLREARKKLLAKHANDFSAAELDAELCHKRLVLIAGGGGGAGFVYIGALARLAAEGLIPDLIVGSSIGALLGAFVARSRKADFPAMLAFAKGMTAGSLFAPPKLVAPHGMPGLLRLHLAGFADVFRRDDGAPMRIADLEVPYEAVVGGIRARVYDRLPVLLRTPRPDGARRGLSQQIAERMWQLTTLVTPNLIDEVVIGRDAETREWDVVEAMGFSAAIPGVLQFEPLQRSVRMESLLDKLCAARGLAAIVDGGVANNVPAKPAWRSVHGGRIGSRNAFYLAFDCFRPQADPRHLWLWPVTQAIQLQLPANRPYFDWLLQFQPTLSPVNLLPSAQEMDKSADWGREQVEAILPLLRKALEPIPHEAVPAS